MFSKLSIMFLTYNRWEYAEHALRSLLDNITWSGDLRVHIADDGSPNGYAEKLRALAGGYSQVEATGVSNSNRGGYGANYNLASQHSHSWADLILQLEDDWVVTNTVDINEIVKVFDDTRVGCIRLAYLGFTQELFGEVLRISGQPVLLLDPLSPEPHLFAGGPHLAKVSWQQQIGPWPEGLTPQETEFYVATKMARRGIVWPMWLHPNGNSLFTHIGAQRSE